MQEYLYASRENATAQAGNTVYLRPEQITVTAPAKTTEQSRNAIIRLSASIQKYGILEPLEVKSADPMQNPLRFELLDGERRLRAALLVGIDRIPCRILPENHRKCKLATILAQLRREPLNFFEQAAAFRMLTADFALTQEEIARKTGFSQSAIANKLRLLQLSKEEQGLILGAELTERHARALLRLREPNARKEAILQVRRRNLRVSDTEQMVDELLADAQVPQNPPKEPEIPQEVPKSPPIMQDLPRTPLRKLVLQDPTPLYNSIERSLSIFRQTGATVLCRREEGSDGVRIVIEIPQQNNFRR